MTYKEALKMVAETEAGFVTDMASAFENLHKSIEASVKEIDAVMSKFVETEGAPTAVRSTLEQYGNQARSLLDQVSYMQTNTAALRNQYAPVGIPTE